MSMPPVDLEAEPQYLNFVSCCRICLEENDDMSVQLNCACRGATGLLHAQCATDWFSRYDNTTSPACDVCKVVVSNVKVVPQPRPLIKPAAPRIFTLRMAVHPSNRDAMVYGLGSAFGLWPQLLFFFLFAPPVLLCVALGLLQMASYIPLATLELRRGCEAPTSGRRWWIVCSTAGSLGCGCAISIPLACAGPVAASVVGTLVSVLCLAVVLPLLAAMQARGEAPPQRAVQMATQV